MGRSEVGVGLWRFQVAALGVAAHGVSKARWCCLLFFVVDLESRNGALNTTETLGEGKIAKTAEATRGCWWFLALIAMGNLGKSSARARRFNVVFTCLAPKEGNRGRYLVETVHGGKE